MSDVEVFDQEPKNILVTAGAVYGRIDDVKIVTNRFKGGRMIELAKRLYGYGDDHIHLLIPKGTKMDPWECGPLLTLSTHDGFEDYRDKVLQLAPKMDAVVLGAAVCNLIPRAPIKGKFPSHNYQPGEEVRIPFMIAPRVIDMVKEKAPHADLFGFKLLSNVDKEELIDAAYSILWESRATAVIANDLRNLNQKHIVTKERAVHDVEERDLASWIWGVVHDLHYHTESDFPQREWKGEEIAQRILEEWKTAFEYTDAYVSRGVAAVLVFGAVAVRSPGGGFFTTLRGKNEAEGLAYVTKVNHEKRTVWVLDRRHGGRWRASLNAPLFDRIFERFARVHHIVHLHKQRGDLPVYPYAPPGTVRDTERPYLAARTPNCLSFNIQDHGCFLLFDVEGRPL
jgi:phosphopantothenate-cysteine ligase